MSTNVTDRNMLFGMLALQMDFVDQDQLVAAMKRWVDDKSRSLGELLVEGSALSPDTRQVLDAVVQKHLDQHGGGFEEGQ